MIWEGDEPGETKTYTYKELLADVCRCANAMKTAGVQKGETVTIYMPMVPEVRSKILLE